MTSRTRTDDRNRQQLKGHLDMLLLSTVRDGPAHGYKVVSRLRTQSGGTFDLPEGTIYPALHRLEGDGLLRSCWRVESGRRRRVYSLTRAGSTALRAERVSWLRFTHAVQAVTGWTA
jgi:PadR family transcriptional regulator